MLSDSWPFSVNPAFEAKARALADSADIGEARFVLRNFLLEQAVPSPRCERYLEFAEDVPTESDKNRLSMFNAGHDSYLNSEVRSGHRHEPFDVASKSTPESFRYPAVGADEFAYADERLQLVRLEEAGFVARSALVASDRLIEMCEEVVQANQYGTVTDTHTHLDAYLQAWQDRSDNRPIYASFWDDAKDLLDPPTDGWPGELRDRLGLIHLSAQLRPSVDTFDVLLFRYSVGRVPKIDTNRRAILRPTVLDGSLSPAFHTGIAGVETGMTVDLAARYEEPWQEVVHATIPMTAADLYAVGSISNDPKASLEDARAAHVLTISEFAPSELVDLYEEVDGDLLA